MSKKIRPTFVCDCGGTITAGCWFVGAVDVTFYEGKLFRMAQKGYWEMSCNKCDYKGKYTP
ncbi:hypothetical protein HOU35_gp068 [Acinetobacter phage vB_AbaM_B09_Aci05]|uniref:Uncharacterized protein n=1 Tax=Acinetobacter phage vB_AbaM_B09_Aci05 TaxID=2315458 RepID=A0A386KCF5_9CAUD|nr:hypothetical protein HOU35_gp068 [Acinetobacter phage vB_AbaM_B09_Aci05]AYD82452.1 hypothetical protein Aci05_109 [Acinetobacter phage vB_AbaM_B09_Aci05]